MKEDLEDLLLESFKACDHCVKRFVKNPSMNSIKRAKKNRKACALCGGLMSDREIISKSKALLRQYLVRSFNVGVRLPENLEKTEEKIVLENDITDYIPLRKALANSLRKSLSKSLKIKVSSSPDVNLILDFTSGSKSMYVIEKKAIFKASFIKERNTRLLAGPCKVCGGKGCPSCSWTGKEKDESLESWLLFELPAFLKASVPKLIWPLKDMSEANFYGNGYPVYLIFSSIKLRKIAPLILNQFLPNNFRMVSFYEIKGGLRLSSQFTIDAKLCVKLSHGCDEEALKTLERLNKIKIPGRESKKVWIKSFFFSSVFFEKEMCCGMGRFDSGINLYNLFGLRETEKDKIILEKPFKPGDVLGFTLDVFRVNLPD